MPMKNAISALSMHKLDSCAGSQLGSSQKQDAVGLAGIRDYLGNRILLMRDEVAGLKAQAGDPSMFASTIKELEALLDQVDQLAQSVMNDAEATRLAVSIPRQMRLASILVGAVARSHRTTRAKEAG